MTENTALAPRRDLLVSKVWLQAVAIAIGFVSLHAMADDAASLRAKHIELREQLANNSFKRAMVIDPKADKERNTQQIGQ